MSGRAVRSRAWGALCAAMILCAGAAASAQEAQNATAFQVEQFEPLPSQGYNLLNVATSEVLPSLRPSFGLFTHYVNDPIQIVPVVSRDVDQGGERLIAHQVKGELSASLGLLNRAELGVVFPMVLYQSGDDLRQFGRSGETIEGFTLGDMRLIPKVMLVNPYRAKGFGVAALLPIYLPTGDTTSFNSDGKVRLEPRLVVDWRHEVGVVFSANVAYQVLRAESVAQNYTGANMFRWGFGMQLPTGAEALRLTGVIHGSISSAEAREIAAKSAQTVFDRGRPVEVDGGLLFLLPADLTINVGAGMGLTAGVGAPDLRVFAALGYASRARDQDGDGLLDEDDQCPARPEDRDGFQDEDGCPDLDNDADGLLDVDDQCPLEAEDRDGFQDEDGCPDPDNDDDGVLDGEDRCAEEKEDRDGFEDEDGCPDLDNDADGLRDENDQCPNEPEDEDGFEDEDGCPDPDNDGDGVLDREDLCPREPGPKSQRGCPVRDRDNDTIPDDVDRCPDEPETFNGRNDEDGCPDGKETVIVTETEIKILQKVFFDTGKDRIQAKSFPLLDTVAAVLKRNPQITKLRVEGHTDDVGDASDNLSLSRRRAEAVRAYLVDQGVESERLIFEGYGEERPLCDELFELLENKRKNRKAIEACRSDNRRVEFRIIEVNGKRISPDDSVIIRKE